MGSDDDIMRKCEIVTDSEKYLNQYNLCGIHTMIHCTVYFSSDNCFFLTQIYIGYHKPELLLSFYEKLHILQAKF